AAALGVGKWAFDKSEEYVEHFVDTMKDWVEDLGNNYVSISPPSFGVIEGREVPSVEIGERFSLSDFGVDFSDYGGYLGTRNLSLVVCIDGNLINLYWRVIEVGEGYNKYRYDFFVNGVKSEANPFDWAFGGMDSTYCVGLQDTLD